jgi:hypothetical protein
MWKHHAGAIRAQIALAVAAGERGLDDFSKKMATIGADLMDLYLGELSPLEIGNQIIASLQASSRLTFEAYTLFLNANGGYQSVTLSDDSRWILRQGERQGRYVHVHPGRWSPRTLRVRANVLKTAILTLALARVRGADPAEVTVINEAREAFLGVSPIAGLKEGRAIRRVIGLLSCGLAGLRRDDECQHEINEDAGNNPGKEGC